MNRQLTVEEKNLTEKNIKTTQEELEYYEYISEHARLMIDKGLRQNYLKQLKEYQDKYREANNHILQAKLLINISQSQLRDGVNAKEEE